MIETKNLTIKEASRLLKEKKITSVELTEKILANISAVNKDMNAYLEVFADAMDQAKESDRKIANGEGGELCGIPLALKDNILVKGRIASASSKILENYQASYDATVIEKLKKEGVVFIGRTNMDEFAMGGSTENSAFGVTKNPYDTTRVAGGSSGGSASALAMDGCIFALGTDTGGSVRQPSSFCGVVGLKPTYGAISRHGIIAMGSSLDQVGPITKTATDSEIVFNLLKGKDGYDATAIEISDETPKLKGKKGVIGIPNGLMDQPGIDNDVLKNFNESVEKFKSLGYEIKNIDLPNIAYSLAVYYILMPAEVSSNMARLDGIRYGLHKDGKNMLEDYFLSRREGFGKEVRRRILLGTYVLSAGYYDAYYNKAKMVRGLIISDFEKAWETVDVVLTPTSPIPAFKIGEKSNDPLAMYLADIFTVTANIAGIPAISIPSGFTEMEGKKLPLGIQLMSKHKTEKTLFTFSKDFLGE